MRDARLSDPRAALEALFSPAKKQDSKDHRAGPRPRAKMVAVPAKSADDPAAVERARLLRKLLDAQGRPAVTRAAEELVRAGVPFPEDQEVQLQLLEHSREERVQGALEVLSRLLEAELPQRRTVLEARLRRLEDDAEEATTRELAAELRKRVGRTSVSSLRGQL